MRASFVPPEPIRQLRALTRYRTTLSVERTPGAQRLEKGLEDALIKLSSVATDILGVSGRAMLAALIGGRDPQVLAKLATNPARPRYRGLTKGIEIDVAGCTAWAPAISAVPPLEAVVVERHDEGCTDIAFSMGEPRRR